MICRLGTPDDARRADVRDLVKEGLYSRDLGIPVNERKLFAFCDAMVNGTHFGAFAEHDGKAVAYIAGVIGDHYWHDRQQMNIVGWYSRHPYAGLKLLHMALAWAAARPYINTVIVTVNPDVSERVGALLSRRGITAHVVPSFLIEV